MTWHGEPNYRLACMNRRISVETRDRKGGRFKAPLGRLGQRADRLGHSSYACSPRSRAQHLHLVPVVGKLLAAIKTHYVRPGYRCGRRTARTTGRNREAIVFMPTAEKQVHQTHQTPLGEVPRKKPFTRFLKSSFSLRHPLDSGELKLVP